MRVQGRPMRTIWLGADGRTVEIIDQTRLPHELAIVCLEELDDAARAISTMQVRGAPLIGATAAYGIALAILTDPSDAALERAAATLAATRPTAVNLRWALDEMQRALCDVPQERRLDAAFARASEIAEADVAIESCDRRARRPADPRDLDARRQAAAGRGAYPLQRRLARHGRLGHRARSDLSC